MTQPPPRRSSGPLNGAESSGGGAGLGTGVEPETSNSESHYNSPALKVTKYFSSSPNHSGSVPKKSNQNKSRTMCPRPRSLPNTELFLNFSRRMIRSTFRYWYIDPRKLQIPGGCTRSTVDTLPPFQNAALRSNPDPGLRAVAVQPAGTCSPLQSPFPRSRRLARPLFALRPCSSPAPASMLPTPIPLRPLRGQPPPVTWGALHAAIGWGIQGWGARPCEVPCPLSGCLFGCCRHLMATRVEEASRGRGGGAEESVEAGRGGRRRSPRQKVSLGGACVVAGPGECWG